MYGRKPVKSSPILLPSELLFDSIISKIDKTKNRSLYINTLSDVKTVRRERFNFDESESGSESESILIKENRLKSSQKIQVSSQVSLQKSSQKSIKKDPYEFKVDKKRKLSSLKEIDENNIEHETIRDMRTSNLKEKSFSSLLLDILFKKYDIPDIINIAKDLNIDLKKITNNSNIRLPSNMLKKKGKNDDSTLSLCIGTESIGVWPSELDSLIARLIKVLGADVEYTDSDGHFPLLLAVQYSESLAIVKLLVENGADVNRCAPYSSELLINAQHKSDQNVNLTMGTFMDTYSPPSIVDIAYRLGNSDVTKYLLKRNSTLSLFDEDLGLKCNSHDSILSFGKMYGFLKTALNSLQKQLYEAVEKDDLLNLKIVLSHDLHPDLVVSTDGKSALYMAVFKKRSLKMIELLLNANANVNKVDKEGVPMMVYPLMRSESASENIVKLFLLHGCNLDAIVTNTGQKLIEFARDSCMSKKSLELVETAYEKVKSKT